MRRYLSIWCPHWPTDRWRRQARRDVSPLVLAAPGRGGVRLTAVDAEAAAEGLAPGMTLADARALVPDLHAAEADPVADAAALAQLADWTNRFSPVTATDGPDGLILDATGCAHLWGGEGPYLAEIADRLARLGLTARLGLADTPAMAWAWARFGRSDGAIRSTIVPAGRGRERLAPLPVAALRLPDALAADLARIGLRRVRDLLSVPRAPLAARYGDLVRRRLDQALGLAPEPIAPRRPPIPWRAERGFAEPLLGRESLEQAARALAAELCRLLEAGGKGARRLDLLFHRVDGTVASLSIGTGRPARDPDHLLRLFREGFERVDPGFGVERLILTAPAVERLDPGQTALDGAAPDGDGLAQLLDRLHARAGARQVRQPAPRGSHIPERAAALAPVDLAPRPADWSTETPRPVLLLARPEPVAVVAPVPDDPPLLFTWRRQRHRVSRADGPERIEPEWWRPEAGRDAADLVRDYYRIEDERGRRFWLFRHGAYRPDRRPAWYLHGLFA